MRIAVMTARTTTLPLFPLALVLFPGMPLPLDIFEERYKRMINLCIARGATSAWCSRVRRPPYRGDASTTRSGRRRISAV